VLKIAVTGTNGKTSTTSFVAQIARAQGLRAAAIGQRLELGDSVRPRSEVPNERDGLCRYFAKLEQSGYDLVAVEAYSAALANGCHRGITYDALGWTNLGEDHLSVHGSMAAYRAAKMRLFEGARAGTPVIVPQGEQTLTEVKADLCALGFEPREAARAPELPFAGFLVRNAGLASGLITALGLAQPSRNALSTLVPPPGRWEVHRRHGHGTVIVDFAHNAFGLETVLAEAREMLAPDGRLSLVLSSKGGWGRAKRQGLAHAARQADRVYITDDDPRDEDPATIREQLAHPLPDALIIAGRPRCLSFALDALRDGDALLVAGRGADLRFQTATGAHPYSDTALVRRWIAADGGGKQAA
jgi:UDP-N-acetylmuramoyl-L-alanyl-D-glutamate--2,6-diaminopimelate ligase